MIFPRFLTYSFWHAGVLHQLKSYGISGQIFGLISHFFSVIYGFKWFWMGSLHKNIQLILEFLKGPFLVLHFTLHLHFTLLLYINDRPDVICDIAIYADESTLYSECDQASDLQQQLELVSELESDL